MWWDKPSFLHLCFYEEYGDIWNSPDRALPPPLATPSSILPLVKRPGIWFRPQLALQLQALSGLLMTAFNRWLVRQNHCVCGCLIAVGFSSWKQTFPDVKAILTSPTLKRERENTLFFGLKGYSLWEAGVLGSSTIKESLQSSLSKYAQSQMIFKGLACLYLPRCSTRPLSMIPCTQDQTLGDQKTLVILIRYYSCSPSLPLNPPFSHCWPEPYTLFLMALWPFLFLSTLWPDQDKARPASGQKVGLVHALKPPRVHNSDTFEQ